MQFGGNKVSRQRGVKAMQFWGNKVSRQRGDKATMLHITCKQIDALKCSPTLGAFRGLLIGDYRESSVSYRDGMGWDGFWGFPRVF